MECFLLFDVNTMRGRAARVEKTIESFFNCYFTLYELLLACDAEKWKQKTFAGVIMLIWMLGEQLTRWKLKGYEEARDL
jgi:hypothetical protein